MSIYIIAEAGVNHNGDPLLARKLVDVAADAGADAVKFQTFRAEAVAVRTAPKADYQMATTEDDETQYDMLRRLELPPEAHHELMANCTSRGIDFLSSPFDRQSLSFLADDLGLSIIKIPSGDITNGPLLLAAGRTGRKLIVSTGMSTMDDVQTALGVLAFGFVSPRDAAPGRAAFIAAYQSKRGQQALQKKVTLLHCTSEYPAPLNEINLRAMATMMNAFGLPVGLSDHSDGIAVPIAAAALGATVIEKHFTTDRNLPGPDHKASLEPANLAAMVAGIRSVEKALGTGIKAPTPSEASTARVARRSLAVVVSIKAGQAFDEINLDALRPGTGVTPMAYWEWLGRKAHTDLPAGVLIPE